MLISGGSFDIFFTRPLSGTIFALMVAVIVYSTVMGIRRQRRGRPAARYGEQLAELTPPGEPEGTADMAAADRAADGGEPPDRGAAGGSTRAGGDRP